MPPPLSMSSPLRAKKALFNDWGLSDDSDGDETATTTTAATTVTTVSLPALNVGVVKQEDNDGADYKKPRLDDAEIEHRRRSKAFTVAAKAALEEEAKRAREKKAKRERKERRREQEEQEERDRERKDKEKRTKSTSTPTRGSAEVIDLTLPKVTPIPPPQIPPPPRRAQSALEFVRKSATLRRTSSNPLPESQGQSMSKSKKRKHDADGAAAFSTKAKASAAGPASSVSLKSTRSGDIFSGLLFYYLPDAALGARKLRIAKAQQHGATWVRDLGEATHVIVDKPFKWAEIESAVRDRRPDALVVYDEYPLDCIGFRCLLNPLQRRYQIAGRPAPAPAPEASLSPTDGQPTGDEEQERERRRKEKGKDKEQAADHEDRDRDRDRDRDQAQKRALDRPAYLIKPDRQHNRRFGVAGSSSSRPREAEQMIRQPRAGGD